jgi:ABC-type nitrate/sulfonate/bicarbonate transport system substrate-binding protein
MRLAAAALVASLLATAASAHQQSRPTLRALRSAHALVIRGSGFYAREGVRVSLRATTSRVKVVRTTSVGTFTAGFDATSTDRCRALVARALGTRGDRALLKVPAPECPPE